ncbi:MAG: pyruvate kinase [Proteocatella sp.]
MVNKKTKIVCTIGPASESPEILRELMIGGMNVCRLNFSHGSHEEHQVRIDTIKKVRSEVKPSVALMLDTKGPEIRTGKFLLPEVNLEDGQKFIISMDDVMGDETRCSISYKGLIHDVVKGNKILIDDGLIELVVEEIAGNDIICTVENAGVVKNNKGVNVPGVVINLPAITEKDKQDIIFGIKNGIDFIAASFVRKAADVMAIREILEQNDGEYIQIISKIENQEGVDNIDEILNVSDGIMVARGDLGVEIPTEEIPVVQKMIIRKCNSLAKPVITATQMLDSMMRNPRPTRAEVTDVANAIYDGTDAIMLSGETAAGKYPIETLETMARIAMRIEDTLDYESILKNRLSLREWTITNAISHASCTLAVDIKANAIITATSSGYTAKAVSSYRPKAPIIAAVNTETIMRQLSLVWGVFTVMGASVQSTDAMFEQSVALSLKSGFVKTGDTVVITAGVPVGEVGTTNLIKVHIVTDVVGRGIGIGNKNISGIARIIEKASDAFEDGDVFVGKFTDIELMDKVQRASAIVVEESGLTSHAAVVGVSLGIPVIVGAKNITKMVKDGEVISLDLQKGFIYRGKISLI